MKGTGTVYRLTHAKDRPWAVRLGQTYLGYFKTKEEAADYLDAYLSNLRGYPETGEEVRRELRRIGRNLDAFLTDTGVYSPQFAKIMNVTSIYVRNWREGLSVSVYDYLPDIASFIGVSEEMLRGSCGPELEHAAKRYKYARLYRDVFEDDSVVLPDNCVRYVASTMDNVLIGRETDYLIARYGLGSQPPMPLRAVGELYGVSAEFVRQQTDHALYLLRQNGDQLMGAREKKDRKMYSQCLQVPPDWAKNITIRQMEPYMHTHTIRSLRDNGFRTLYDLMCVSDADLMACRGIGEVSVSEAREASKIVTDGAVDCSV